MSQQLTPSESPLSQRSGSSWALAHNQKVPKWFYQTELKLKIITWTCLSSRLIFDRCLTLLQSSERRDLKNVYLPLNQEKGAMQLFSSFQSKIHSLNSSSIHKKLKLFREKKSLYWRNLHQFPRIVEKVSLNHSCGDLSSFLPVSLQLRKNSCSSSLIRYPFMHSENQENNHIRKFLSKENSSGNNSWLLCLWFHWT